jgi:hypothetical protein
MVEDRIDVITRDADAPLFGLPELLQTQLALPVVVVEVYSPARVVVVLQHLRSLHLLVERCGVV